MIADKLLSDKHKMKRQGRESVIGTSSSRCAIVVTMAVSTDANGAHLIKLFNAHTHTHTHTSGNTREKSDQIVYVLCLVVTTTAKQK